MDSNSQPPPIAGTPAPAQPGPFQPAPSMTGPAPAPAEPAPTVVATRRPRRDPLPIVLALAALVAVGGISFAAGRLSAPEAAARTGLTGAGLPGTGQRGGLGNGQGQPGNGNGNGFGNIGRALGSGLAIRGTVTAVAADHITIRTESGQSVDIPTGAATTYHRQAAATATDVTAGTSVLVQLEPNTGGAGQPGSSGAPNASNLPGGLGRFFGTARDITIVAQ